MKRAVIKVGSGVVIALGVLAGAGRLAFVPSAKEPPYAFASAWGGKGHAPGQFDGPTAIAVAGGEVFFADSRNGRIQVFDPEGRFRRQFGTPGEGAGQLGRPMGLVACAALRLHPGGDPGARHAQGGGERVLRGRAQPGDPDQGPNRAQAQDPAGDVARP